MSRSSQQSGPSSSSSSSSYMAASSSSSRPTSNTSSTTAANNTPALRYSTAHSNSSAFSASANPNEDWTKISDLAERRRIQNRIAQRNYRKKLKRRLEDLEKKAASTESSPEPQSAPYPTATAPTSQASIIEAPQPLQTLTPTSSVSPAPSAESIIRPSSASSAYLTCAPSFDESAIFTPQYRHTYTASPPIMSFPTPPMSHDSFSQYSPTPSYAAGYAVSPPPSDFPPHFHHSPALSSAQSAVSSEDVSIKSEFFDEDVSQFNLNYSPLDSHIGGQFVDCSNPTTGPALAPSSSHVAPFPNDPTIYAPLSQDFDSLDPFEGASLVSPDFWALYPDAPQFISV